MPLNLAALAALALIAAPSEPTSRTAADSAAIEAVIAGQTAAWARGDAEGFAAASRPDVVFTNIIGMFSVGRAPFVAQHQRIFAGVYKGSQVTQTLTNLTFVRPDVAIVDTLTEVRNYRELPPGMQPVDGALRTRLEQVMVRDDGAWRVASFHNVTVSPAAVQPAPPPAAPK